MKSLVAISLFLSTVSAFAAENFIVNSQVINKTGKPLVVAITAEYVAQSSNPFCKSVSIPEGQMTVNKKTVQRAYFIDEKETVKEIPSVYGVCKYTLQSVGVKVFDKVILERMASFDGAKEVEEGTFEYKGSLGAIGVQVKAGSTSNLIKCKPSSFTTLSFDCDKASNEIFTDGSVLNIKFDVSK